MSGDAPVPRPETLALNAFIHAVLRHSGIERRSSAAGNTLFLAIGLHAIPASLVYDAMLDPVDKIVWQVVFQAGVEDGGCGAFPSYKTINAAANLGSSATVSRALAMLRLTRWMTCVTHDHLPQHSVSRSVQVLHCAPSGRQCCCVCRADCCATAWCRLFPAPACGETRISHSRRTETVG